MARLFVATRAAIAVGAASLGCSCSVRRVRAHGVRAPRLAARCNSASPLCNLRSCVRSAALLRPAPLSWQAKQQMAQQQMSLILTDQGKKCFEACLGRPGTSLSSREQTCLANCQKRWYDVFKIVQEEVVDALRKSQSGNSERFAAHVELAPPPALCISRTMPRPPSLSHHARSAEAQSGGAGSQF